jgi:hypothetical protein
VVSVSAALLPPQEKIQQAVFDEWKELQKELDDIGQELGIDTPVKAPTTSTPTVSPPAASASASGVATNSAQAAAPTPALPTEPPVMTTSGSDPFGGSFFDLSFGSPQPLGATTAPAATPQSAGSGDPHIFDNPFFNGENGPMPEAEVPAQPTHSTPEGKQLTYASRPRPKGKALDTLTPLSPLPASDAATDGGNPRAARELSLSPNGEEEVKSILANTDPFTPPMPDVFQFPQGTPNGSSLFQPAPFSPNVTPSSGYFSPSSVLTQDSIQLVNPLYQSNGSISGPFSPPTQQPVPVMMSPPAALMQPQFQPQSLVMMQQIQPAPITAQPPDLMGPHPMHLMGMNGVDGILSPTAVNSPPQVGNPSLAAQNRAKWLP